MSVVLGVSVVGCGFWVRVLGELLMYRCTLHFCRFEYPYS